MKNQLLKVSVLLLVIGMSTTSMAQVNKRQTKQKQRVSQGVASGEITKKEAAQIQIKQAEVQALENAARADGEVTKQEKAVITREQNEASRQIKRKKSNRRDRN